MVRQDHGTNDYYCGNIYEKMDGFIVAKMCKCVSVTSLPTVAKETIDETKRMNREQKKKKQQKPNGKKNYIAASRK